jgi:hypothetical protein
MTELLKDSPAPGDVHQDSAGGDNKPGKKKPKKDEEGMKTEKFAQVLKVDESLGLVMGWAIVCKQMGVDYYDLQDDHIPEAAMLSASVDFMQNSRMAGEMHDGEGRGSIVFAFPMTSDIAKAFGIDTKITGLMIAMKPDSDEMLEKFRDGTYTGFSIGGARLEDEAA